MPTRSIPFPTRAKSTGCICAELKCRARNSQNAGERSSSRRVCTPGKFPSRVRSGGCASGGTGKSAKPRKTRTAGGVRKSLELAHSPPCGDARRGVCWLRNIRSANRDLYCRFIRYSPLESFFVSEVWGPRRELSHSALVGVQRLHTLFPV